MRFITNNPEQTRALGKKLAQDFLEKAKKNARALIISCEGELGAGKTTFIQGLAKGFGVKAWIKSPTFVLMRQHSLSKEAQKGDKKSFFYHLDCYRLTGEKEIQELGIQEILRSPENIVVIEWGDKFRQVLPPETIRIKFKHQDKNKREIIIE